MKRIGALICLMIMAVSMLAPACFAEDETDAASTSANTGFTIKSSSPEDGATGVSVDNLSVKIYFDKEMLPTGDNATSIRKANAKEFKLTDKDGTEIPIKVYYSHKEEGLMMVVSDVFDSEDITIEGDTDYKLTIGDGLQSADGTKLGAEQVISFKTLDQARSTTVYTIMMVVMIAGMIFFSVRSAKKAAEKDSDQKKNTKKEAINPYKEAKRTGKSVEEIVEREKKKKNKQAEADAKKRAKQAELDAELDAEIEARLAKEAAKKKAATTKKVKSRRPISAAGSEYKIKVAKTKTEDNKQQQQKKGTTNPKKQTGKQKNAKNKNKKK